MRNVSKKNETFIPEEWLGKRYHSLDAYLKNTYHKKLYKIALNAGLTCPNRDGTLDTRGCIFCSAGGSGDFAISRKDYPNIQEQLDAGIGLFHTKNIGDGFIAYFQAYTNTYGSISYLRQVYSEALENPNVYGISIATRPDCLGTNVLALLNDLKSQYPNKFIWIELGLQTIHEETANWMRRGYGLSTFVKAVSDLNRLEIPIIVHIILGLPGETTQMLLETIDYINALPISGIKLQLLHIIKDTDLDTLYKQGKVISLTQEAYIEQLLLCIDYLRPDIVIHRLTGDGPKDLLQAPLWSLNKRNVLNKLNHELTIRNIFQGRSYHVSRCIDPI